MSFYLGSFIIEKGTGLDLLIFLFKWKKSTLNAKRHLRGATVEYVLICLGVFIYDLYDKNINLETIDIFGIGTTPFVNGCVVFLLSFSLLPLMTIWFEKYYERDQGHDPDKSDDDLT